MEHVSAEVDLQSADLSHALEELRVPLTGYCYRMIGAAADADDVVQETIIRAHRALDRFDPNRSRLTTWVHRIAHNACVDHLRSARRRELAVAFGPASEPGAPLPEPLPADHWLTPMPDARLLATSDPAELLAQRETIQLAFLAALQHLSAIQRSTLILRDVLAYTAQETAEILDCTPAAANSALQRARAKLSTLDLSVGDVQDPGDPDQRALLSRYVAAFEAHDVPGLLNVLAEDAITSMPPFPWWICGGARIATLIGDSDSCAGARLVPTVINGMPGFGQYRPDGHGNLAPFTLVAVEISGGAICHLMTFLGTGDRFAEFGLPERLD